MFIPYTRYSGTEGRSVFSGKSQSVLGSKGLWFETQWMHCVVA